jgi:predicted nucleic acid-binding Zn ribbon protein
MSIEQSDQKEFCMSECGNFVTYNQQKYKWTARGYQKVSVRNPHSTLQRAVWTLNKGNIPEKLYVCHKDGDKRNNKIDNLELLSKSCIRAKTNKSFNRWAKTEVVKKSCLLCSKIFECKDKNAKFCSKKCYDKNFYLTKTLTRFNDRSCIVCNTKFTTKHRSKRKTCSLACTNKYARLDSDSTLHQQVESEKDLQLANQVLPP